MDDIRKRFWDQLLYAGEDSYECHNCGCMAWDAGKHIEWHVTMLDLAKLVGLSGGVGID
jgi:hypothetical protein